MCDLPKGALSAIAALPSANAFKLYYLALERGAQAGTCPHGVATRTWTATWRVVQGVAALGRQAQESARELLAAEGWLLDRRGPNDALEELTVLLERCTACGQEEARAALERQRRREEARAARAARRAEREAAREKIFASPTPPSYDHDHDHDSDGDGDQDHHHLSDHLITDPATGLVLVDDAGDRRASAEPRAVQEELARHLAELGVRDPEKHLAAFSARRIRFVLWKVYDLQQQRVKVGPGLVVRLLAQEGPLPGLLGITVPAPSRPQGAAPAPVAAPAPRPTPLPAAAPPSSPPDPQLQKYIEEAKRVRSLAAQQQRPPWWDELQRRRREAAARRGGGQPQPGAP